VLEAGGESAAEALQYNALVRSWRETSRLAQGSPASTPAQSELGRLTGIREGG
jgi:hypothetical protein